MIVGNEGGGSDAPMIVARKIAAHMIRICADVAEIAQGIIPIIVMFARKYEPESKSIADLEDSCAFPKPASRLSKSRPVRSFSVSVTRGIAAGQVYAETIL